MATSERRRKEKMVSLKRVFGMEPDYAAGRVERLSKGELKLAELLSLGYSRDSVVSELRIVLSTFHRRRADVRKKLGVHTSCAIVAYYLCWKMVKEIDRQTALRRERNGC